MRTTRALVLFALSAPIVAGGQAQRTTSSTVVDSTRLEASHARSLTDALGGKVDGGRVVTTTGRPGISPIIVLRAAGMNADDEPLIVVDGIIRRLGIDDLNIEDIERVEIIKGAAGGALYGTGAGNGVLLITTKHGAAEDGRLALVVRSEFGNTTPRDMTSMSAKHAFQMNAAGTDFLRNSSGQRLFEADRIADNPYPSYRAPMSSFVGGRSVLSNRVSASQRILGVSIATSLRSERDDGILKSVTAFRRQSGGLALDDVKVWRVSLSGRAFVANTSDDALDALDGTFQMLPPVEPQVRTDSFAAPCPVNTSSTGNGCFVPLTAGSSGSIGAPAQFDITQWNPNEYFRATKQPHRGQRWNAGLSAGYSIKDWLSATAKVSTERMRWRSTSRQERSSYDVSDSGRVSVTSVAISANRDLPFGIHTLNRLEYSDERTRLATSSRARSLFAVIPDPVTGLPDTLWNSAASWSYGAGRINAVVLSTSAEVGEKVTVDAGLRREVSSSFPWNLSRPMLTRVAVGYRPVPTLSVRAAQGTSVSTPDLAPPVDVVYPHATPIVKQPKLTESEIGADFAVGRASLTVSYSRQRTKDFLAYGPTPSSLGFTNEWQNVGDIAGQTLEFSLAATLLKRGAFAWEANLSGHRTRARIASLRAPEWFQAVRPSAGQTVQQLVRTGEVLGVIYGTRWIRTADQLNESIASGGLIGPAANYRLNEEGYYVRLADYGTPSEVPLAHFRCPSSVSPPPCPYPDASQPIADLNPDLEFGADSRMRIGLLVATVSISGALGGDIYNSGRWMAMRYGRDAVVDQSAKVSGRKPVTFYQALAGFGTGFNVNDYFVESGTYVNVRALSLEWTLPSLVGSGLELVGLAGARIAVIVRNPWVSRSYAGFDADAGSISADLVGSRISTWAYPNYRTISAVVTVAR